MTVEVDTGDSGEAADVTYVGGRAVEQNTEGETPTGDHGDELAAAKAAVKAAIEEAGRSAAKDTAEHLDKDPMKSIRGADGKFASTKDPVEAELDEAKAKLTKELAPKVKPVVDEDAERDASALRKALQERKEAAKYKAEAAAQVEQARAEARQLYAQLQAEKQEMARERERIQMLRKDPIRAIRENGWNPEEFILDIANDGTPEGQARRAQRELQEQIAELTNWKREQAEAVERQKAQAAEQEKAQFRRNVEQQFLNAAAARTQEGTHKNTHLVSMYKDDPAALIVQADLVAERYRNATGKDASFEEIAEYLEERAAKWYRSMSEGRSATKAVAPVTKGSPTPGSATGKRSLSPSGSSERRSLGTSLSDLDGDERLAAAREAVAAALRASGER